MAQQVMAEQSKRMADFMFWQLILGVALLIGVGVTIYYARQIARAAVNVGPRAPVTADPTQRAEVARINQQRKVQPWSQRAYQPATSAGCGDGELHVTRMLFVVAIALAQASWISVHAADVSAKDRAGATQRNTAKHAAHGLKWRDVMSFLISILHSSGTLRQQLPEGYQRNIDEVFGGCCEGDLESRGNG
jgi:hypothetical protein